MGTEHCRHCGADRPADVARCGSCGEPVDPSRAVGTDGRELTRPEQFAIGGGVLMAAGTLLPWASGFGVTASGLSFDAVPQVVLSAGVAAVVLALPKARPALRAAGHLVVGLTVCLWGMFLLLGLPSPGWGLLVLLAGGLAVATVGYAGFRCHTSWLKATAVGCFATLAINIMLLVVLL